MKIISKYEYNELKKLAEKGEHVDHLKKQIKDSDERIDSLIRKEYDQEAEVERRVSIMREEFELNEKKVVAAYEDKMNKLENKLEREYQKKLNDVETALKNEKHEALESMLKGNYDKLSESMQRLHEEGNAQTKFMQETTQTIIKAAKGFGPTHTSRLEYSEDK